MADKDEVQFLEFVMKSGKVVLLPRESRSIPFLPAEIPPKPSPEYPPEWPYFLFNYSVSSNLVTKSGKRGYYLDPIESSVIEFSPSTKHGRILYPGRIWAQLTYLDQQTKSSRPKEAQFEKWYETLAKQLKSEYKQLTATPKMMGEAVVVGVAGPDALRFLQCGGMLALNVVGVKKRVEGRKCPVCAGSVEEEAVLLSDGTVRTVYKCLDLKCPYSETPES